MQKAPTTPARPLSPPATVAAATLTSCSKVFGNFAAVRNVSVTFPQGSATMLLGENGAGKSTVLRLVAGLIAPSRGNVQVFGDLPHNQRHRMAYMSHAPMLYDELSAIENLNYFAGLHKDGGCACVGNPEMALRSVGLDPFLTRPVGQYSQGMRQRTSLARVLQSDPHLLLLDEPFSNLDAASTRQMIDLLADFRTWPLPGGGLRTIILTTHQAALAAPLADRTLTLSSGELQPIAEPAA